MPDGPFEHSWLHPAIEVRDSPIHGRGLFAQEAISEGTVVIEIKGVPIDDAQLRDLTPPYSSVGLGDGSHLLVQADDPVRFGNHSCDPNLWMDGAVREITRRPIAVGEELTVDYATQTTDRSWTMLCRCGSSLCRLLITGEDWRRPELQLRHGDHWTPELLRRRERPDEW